MIKLSEHLYIHWLTLAMFASAYITRTLGLLSAAYAVMLLHELAHTAAAGYLKLGVSRIVMYPFGVTLKIRSRMLCSAADALALYLCGPAVNALAALASGMLNCRGVFYCNNIVLFVLNMLPILPLDGGQLAEYILSSRLGYKNAGIIMKISSALASALLVLMLWRYGQLNLNTVTFCLFIIGGIFTQKEKYSRDLVRELTLAADARKCARGDLLVVNKDYPMRSLIKKFNPSKGAIVVFTDKNGAIVRTATDVQIVSELTGKSK